MRDLGRRAFTGFVWAAASQAGGKLLVFAATLVLARVLVPSEFGLVAFALAVIYYLEYVTDLGLGAALIYRSDAEDPRVSSTAFWIGMLGAVVLLAASWLAAPLLADVGPGEAVVPLFRVLALQFLFSALGKAHEYRLRRSLQFRTLFWPELAGGVAKGVVSVALAVAGAGAWSLVIGQLAGTLTQSVGLWIVHPFRPGFTISRRHVAPMMRFGLGIVAVGLLGQGAKNFDYVVVGGKLGAAALGVYYLAFRLPELVIVSGFRVANDVLFPFYARLRDGPVGAGDDDLRRGYLQTIRLGAMVAWPAALGMAGLALPLVLALYGERWRAAAAPMAFVAIWAGLASLASMPGAVFKALGRSWLLTATGIMQIAILFPAIWFAAPHGITAVAASQVAEKTVSLALLGVITGRVLGIPWYSAFTAGAPALGLSALMAAVLYVLAASAPPGIALAVGIPLGMMVYLLLLRRLSPDGFRMLARPLLELRRRTVAAGLPVLLASLVLISCGGAADRPPPVAAASDATPSPRHTFYVAPDGSDGAPGTMTRPFRTVAHALKRLRYGERLYVRGGTYTERVDVKVEPGRSDARVRVSNFPGERPILRGQLWIGNPSYWTIRGINVTWADGGANQPLVRIYGGTDWELTRSEIWGAHSAAGLAIDDGPRNNLGRWAITQNCIHDTFPTNGVNQDHNIYVGDMSTSPQPEGVISHNILFNAENGRGIKLGPGGDAGGAVNVDVRFNTIYNSSQNVSLSRDTSRVTIERNILVKARESNITGFMLRGTGNVARQNIADAAPRFLDSDGAPGSLVDGGGNFYPTDPQFDSVGCTGFHSARFRTYGAYG
jgi:O-antigen/teichoic acid export membrane protein